jgi:hypothetical protein
MSYQEHDKGAIASLLVHADLITKGYQVFAEDTSQGLIDLVAVCPKTGTTRYFDVKSLSRRENGSKINRTLKTKQKDFEAASGLKIELVYADTETHEVNYPRRRG